jgi:hypothetical protein
MLNLMRQCSWCHKTNTQLMKYCRYCGHAAHRPKHQCDCLTCRTENERFKQKEHDELYQESQE